jgi:hypothetical protein
MSAIAQQNDSIVQEHEAMAERAFTIDIIQGLIDERPAPVPRSEVVEIVSDELAQAPHSGNVEAIMNELRF